MRCWTSCWPGGAPARAVGVATVVATWRSAPRPAGASMLVGPDGEAVGSVSGGCVEGAVYELGQQVSRRGQPVLQRYGVSDDDAFAVGLTCGGILDVFVERVDRDSFPELGEVAADIEAGRPVAVVHRHRAPRPGPGRAAAGRPARGRRRAGAGTLGSRARRRRGHRRRPRAAGRRPHRDPAPTARTGERRGEGMRGVRRVVRAQAADARVRRDRLRGGGGPGRRVPRLPGDGLRRPAGVRHALAVPRRRRGRRRVAAPLPRGRGRGRPHRRPHRPRACSPTTRSSTCRCWRSRCGCRRRLRRRDGLAAHARRPARRGCARPG